MRKKRGHVVFRVGQSYAFRTSVPHFTFRIPHFTDTLVVKVCFGPIQAVVQRSLSNVGMIYQQDVENQYKVSVIANKFTVLYEVTN